VTDLDYWSGGDRVFAVSITGTPDLVHLPRAVRDFLSGVNQRLAVDALLVVAVLGGDAFRYGEPPVTLRLGHGSEVQYLRIEGRGGPAAVAEHPAVRLPDPPA
jgi:hypothetical protein